MAEPSRTRIVADVDFDKDGTQHGFLRLFHSTHASAYGFIPIPIVVIRNGPGPTAFFMSGNHGDEYEGQVALCNLTRWLTPERITGRIILLPAANFAAAMAGRRVSPIDDLNLNRVFPGDPDGTVTQQIAWYIENELIPLADIMCDLHSGGSSLMYVPTALISRSRDPERRARQVAALEAFGAPDAYMSDAGPGGRATASGGADRKGVVALGTELGGSGTVTPAALASAERGLRNLLVHVGILRKRERIEPARPTRYFDVGGPDYFSYAPDPGVFEPVVELGEAVHAGQVGGRLHFPETPWAEPAEVRFQRDGVVLCKRIPGRSARGDCLFHLGTEHKR
ncbi:MAG TPA: succinylglutamate desuccinylase/aspartoacylase family protein [Acetobacteraceae bacterium]|nr:succinylglutamate desuccinylase/aspartoacylase family protein [Acetobacteraceae bacterium]